MFIPNSPNPPRGIASSFWSLTDGNTFQRPGMPHRFRYTHIYLYTVLSPAGPKEKPQSRANAATGMRILNSDLAEADDFSQIVTSQIELNGCEISKKRLNRAVVEMPVKPPATAGNYL